MAVRARIPSFDSIGLCLRALLACCLFLCATHANANVSEVRLHDHLQPATAPASDLAQGWDWISLDDAASLEILPSNWRLLVDQVRFEKVGVVVITRDGRTIRTIRPADQLKDNWSPGGVLTFDIEPSGAEIERLYLGFEAVGNLGLMRKVIATSPEGEAILNARWIALMSLYTGLLLSAFVYNLLVHAGLRHAFQRWYLGWVGVMLAYGLTWSNLAAYAFPSLAGPIAARVDNIFVSTAVALGGMFLISVLETGTVPHRLRRAAQVAAGLSVGCGLLAADERIVPADIGDALLNFGMIAVVLTSLVVVGVAIRRKSRVVWIYLAGWTPVIGVFGARMARNFGMVGQTDAVDYATFGAIGFEALVFSLLIASRFAMLRKQRDAAQASAREMHIEQETLQRAAHTDFLTGLGNRASFQATLGELWDEAAPFALFLIDVDYLKELNDRQGHDAGDALLKFIGAKLADLEPAAICCARIGGDEFAILVREESGKATRISKELDALQGSVWARGTSSGILSLSVGMANSKKAITAADLFKLADLALYEAKKGGRGRQQTFDESMRLSIQTRAELVIEAHKALARSEFELHFQPIIDLRSQQVTSVEALLRWNHPTRGLLAPGAFECVFEDPAVGPAIQRHVLKLAIAWLRRHAGSNASLSVNFNSMDLRGAESAQLLLSLLQREDIPPSALCVEVTEGTVFGRTSGEPAAALRVLHAAGVRVALDDFGTGYASLIHLKEIPVDVLKIDRSFVGGLLKDDGASEQIVRAVLGLGNGLGKEVIAEGIETSAQLDRLRELGCVYGQGFLLGRPEPDQSAAESVIRAA